MVRIVEVNPAPFIVRLRRWFKYHFTTCPRPPAEWRGTRKDPPGGEATTCICPVLTTSWYRVKRKRRESLIIFPLTTCPMHAEYGILPEPPAWWPENLKRGG